MTKSNSGRKRLFQFTGYSSSLKAGTQAREEARNHERTLFTGFLSIAAELAFLQTPEKVGTFPTSIISQENVPTDLLTGQLDGGSSSIEVLYSSGDSRFCQVNKNNQHRASLYFLPWKTVQAG